jgi:nitronate monooxygenase
MMLGADGALVGSRLWASVEANVSDAMVRAAIDATGDATIRSSVMDKVRGLDWPERYTARVLRNAFTDRWHDDLTGLMRNAELEAANWKKGWAEGDPECSNTFVGEAAGLIHHRLPARDILERMMSEASERLKVGAACAA